MRTDPFKIREDTMHNLRRQQEMSRAEYEAHVKAEDRKLLFLTVIFPGSVCLSFGFVVYAMLWVTGMMQ